jgi:hypothetical protein
MVANIPTALWAEIPENLRPGLARWIVRGIVPGSFLSAVIRADLFAAAIAADEKSILAIGYIARLICVFRLPYGARILLLWKDRPQSERDAHLRDSFENYPEFIEVLQKEAAL